MTHRPILTVVASDARSRYTASTNGPGLRDRGWIRLMLRRLSCE
jgi:hypothetical protein